MPRGNALAPVGVPPLSDAGFGVVFGVCVAAVIAGLCALLLFFARDIWRNAVADREADARNRAMWVEEVQESIAKWGPNLRMRPGWLNPVQEKMPQWKKLYWFPRKSDLPRRPDMGLDAPRFGGPGA